MAEIVGRLQRSQWNEDRFCVDDSTWQMELTSGTCVDVKIRDRWVSCRVEYSHAREGYYLVVCVHEVGELAGAMLAQLVASGLEFRVQS